MKMKKIIPMVMMATLPTVGMAQDGSGLFEKNFDRSVKPQDDFYQFATGGWQKVSSGAGTGYVNAEYLTPTAPAKPSASAASAKPSASPSAAGKDLGSSTNSPCGSNIDSGITDRAVSVKRAICTNYPDVQNFLGRRGDGEHSSGRAIDVMVSGARVREIAGWLRAHASELGVIEVIYEQKIWTQQRSGEGWRQMSDRGGRTANHYDHIHVLVR